MQRHNYLWPCRYVLQLLHSSLITFLYLLSCVPDLSYMALSSSIPQPRVVNFFNFFGCRDSDLLFALSQVFPARFTLLCLTCLLRFFFGSLALHFVVVTLIIGLQPIPYCHNTFPDGLFSRFIVIGECSSMSNCLIENITTAYLNGVWFAFDNHHLCSSQQRWSPVINLTMSRSSVDGINVSHSQP